MMSPWFKMFARRSAIVSTLYLVAGSCLLVSADAIVTQLGSARDRQDLAALDGKIAELRDRASSQAASADAQYHAALAYSYAAEVAMELHDKKRSAGYAETGLDYVRKAVSVNGGNPEFHRLFGQMCGQVIPANPLFGALKYGQCARDEISRAIELDSRFALAYVSQGVGNYYLPESMGGGPSLALQNFDKAISIDPKLAEAYLWKGIALKKQNRNAEARQAFQQALAIDPNRLWAKQELDKTPAH
ncbi:MAG TPA: tetratricopeptide repeat protein [Bryobacteraceae bacterium]|jgi:tetratricopeptide (TPR) repeat protein|nr:tetratricopeptide repeat protein [Bryobacteraceae bacterium]